MRLHRLSITAFGPFVETAEVDFDALTDSGLFLLSGATGSGKSSVLDAVCFALYGAIPGDRNHAGRLRSDQAPAGLTPCVELDVTLSGRRFRVFRSPAWERPKKRGAGLTREPAKVTVTERVRDSWVPLSSRLDEAGDLLSGLLGMNLDQFCQVALLPQGHFQAFLRADSAQRHQLLARLFRTGRFERVEGWLRDHRLTLRRESQTHLTSVSDLVSRLSEAAASEAPETVADLAAAAGDRSLWCWADELTRTTETGLAAAESDVQATLAVARDASQVWEQARHEAHARSRVLEAGAAHERLTAAADEHAADVARLEAGRRAEGLRPLSRLVDDRRRRLGDADDVAQAALAEATACGLDPAELSAELGRLTHELSALTVLLPAEQHLSELRARHDSRADALQALQRDDELAAAEGVTLTRLVTRLDVEVRGAVEAERALPTVEAEAVRLRGVAAAHADEQRLQAELALGTADHAAAVGRLLDVREHLLEVRERRIAGMAAELAGALAVGDDCPVCGSAEHPHPALPARGHPDAAAERTAQRAVDDAQALEHALALRVRDAGSALATVRAAAAVVAADDLDRVVEAAERVLSETRAEAARHAPLTAQLTEAQQRARALADERDVRRVRVAELTTTLEHLHAQAAELEHQVAGARGEHPALAQAVEQLEVRHASAEGACEALAARAAAVGALHEAELALTRAALEAGFDDTASARRAELAADDLARLDDRVRSHRSALAVAETVLAEPGARQLLGTPEPDLEALETSHRAAATALEQARAARQVATRRQARVLGLADELRLALDAWTPVREQLELATAVSAFAEGKAPDNRLQMRLSAYVLAYRLTQVVAAANARLAGMSDQRYSLEHVGQRGAGESRGGLSLVVRDDWSGESRDPATLSGGETFVVSLALALGLADVVAHEAGGADLATLFVDEGFGSLDAETLDDVLDILDTLRENGRAVGVVSHVAEMRDRIPTQLVVTKARTGSTVRVSC
jgi:exonuclease SbcC